MWPHQCHVPPNVAAACCADTLRNEFLAAYGHQHLLTLTHLERAGAQLLAADSTAAAAADSRCTDCGPVLLDTRLWMQAASASSQQDMLSHGL